MTSPINPTEYTGAREIRLLPLSSLRPYDRNSRTHTPAQVQKVAASIAEFGFTNPILVDGTGEIIAGHCRVEAAKMLGLDQVPTVELPYLSPEQKRALVIADNRLALDAGWDEEMLASELADLEGLGFDLDLIGFTDEELRALLDDDQDDAPGSCSDAGEAPRKLADRFGIPPFTVLDARQGWWTERKEAWKALGLRSELGRGEGLAYDPKLIERQKGYSQ